MLCAEELSAVFHAEYAGFSVRIRGDKFALVWAGLDGPNAGFQVHLVDRDGKQGDIVTQNIFSIFQTR